MKSNNLLVQSIALVWALAFVPAYLGQPTEQTAVIEHIKERAAQYYAAIQSNEISKAREYVIAKSRPTFTPQLGGKIVGVKVAEVELEKNRDSAVVKVLCQVMVPEAMQAVDVPEYNRWKLDSGEWYFDPADPPKSLASLFKEYYWDKQAARKRKDPDQPAPPLDVQFESQNRDFGIAVKGTTVTVRYAFTNLTSRDLIVEKVFLHQHLMKDITENRVVRPGQKGEIAITLDTTPLYRDVEHDIFVQFEPIKEIIKLRLKGKVFTAKDLEAYRPNS